MRNPTTLTHTSRRIYVCKVCKTAQTVDHALETTQHYLHNGLPSYRDTVAIEANGEPISMVDLDRRYGKCPDCKAFRKANQVKGHKSDHVCDARCTNATGPDCDCSCGGANHGIGHMLKVAA